MVPTAHDVPSAPVTVTAVVAGAIGSVKVSVSAVGATATCDPSAGLLDFRSVCAHATGAASTTMTAASTVATEMRFMTGRMR
jgi:hypothetical protein